MPAANFNSPERTLPSRRLRQIALLLLVWIIAVEAGVRGWYAWRDSQSWPNPSWQVVWPTNAPAYATKPFPDATRNLLRFDDGGQAAWNGSDDRRWEVIYLRWNPGRTSGYLSKLHTPQACLPAMGLELAAGPEFVSLPAGRLSLPFQRYVFGIQGKRADVFYCRWSDRGELGNSLVGISSWGDRFHNVWEGSGNAGQRVLEIVLWDYPDATAANIALQKTLTSLIQEAATHSDRPASADSHLIAPRPAR